MAETYALSNGVEHGLLRCCEETASASVGRVWFTDCESLFSHLVSPNM